MIIIINCSHALSVTSLYLEVKVTCLLILWFHDVRSLKYSSLGLSSVYCSYQDAQGIRHPLYAKDSQIWFPASNWFGVWFIQIDFLLPPSRGFSTSSSNSLSLKYHTWPTLKIKTFVLFTRWNIYFEYIILWTILLSELSAELGDSKVRLSDVT